MSRRELPAVPGIVTAADLDATAQAIVGAQRPWGEIPWFDGHTSDAWNHTEAAMALVVAGRDEQARHAFDWLVSEQRPDGSWPTKWLNGAVHDPLADTNQCAYLAVGVWHYWLITRDDAYVATLWPAVRRAMEFVTSLQTDRGEMWWKRDPDGTNGDHALLTGCSSTYQSLRCAIALAGLMDELQPEWELSAGRLAHCVAEHPEAFADKSQFSMDWYYPVLGGPVRGPRAIERIEEHWNDFVVPGLGVRCVRPNNWVTAAETCELVMTLDALGDRERALMLFEWVQHLRCEDGSYWTGHVFDTGVHWPGDRSTYTAAAVILAADALSETTPAAGIFRAEDLPTGVDLEYDACGCASPYLARSDLRD